jgi:23S rRNA (guanine745-N1)-methyltransferase
LTSSADRAFVCPANHHYDIARQGHVNLLRPGRPRPRVAGDSPEMVRARRAFLDSGAYEPISDAVTAAVAASLPVAPCTVLDVGCGEGYYTRRLHHAFSFGNVTPAAIDISSRAVSAAASRDDGTWYAIASAFDIPVADGSIAALVSVFGPVAPDEYARVAAPGAVVVAAHPGPDHLDALRALVYDTPHPHDVKAPLRNDARWSVLDEHRVRYRLTLTSGGEVAQLLAMTPYRWHAPRDIDERIAGHIDSHSGFSTTADVVVTRYGSVEPNPGRPETRP